MAERPLLLRWEPFWEHPEKNASPADALACKTVEQSAGPVTRQKNSPATTRMTAIAAARIFSFKWGPVLFGRHHDGVNLNIGGAARSSCVQLP